MIIVVRFRESVFHRNDVEPLLPPHPPTPVAFPAAAGEIQGTVHRCLLVDREEELKVGAVLLLKQVGQGRMFVEGYRNELLIFLNLLLGKKYSNKKLP